MKKKKTKILSVPAFIVVYLAVILACIALDQLTKMWIFDQLLQGTPGNSVNVLGNFMRFEALYNKGAAFGMGQADGANIVFFVVTIVGVPLFSWLLWRSRKRSVCGQVAYAFIVGGTIGNFIDRGFIKTEAGKFFSGKVRDFISFSFFNPIFNVADSFLVIGVFMAILAIIFFDEDCLVNQFQKDKLEREAVALRQINDEPVAQPAAVQDKVDSENTDEKN